MIENSRPRLIIFYDYFYPAYKAGGPVQSLTNLVLSLQDEYEISIVTSAYDLNDDQVLDKIITDDWSEVMLPLSPVIMKIWYAASGKLGIDTIKKIIKQVAPSVIYLNGMFSFRFVLLPLIAIKKVKLIICPRGMLQKGALAGKPVKKKIYLAFLKISGLLNNVTWHATNEYEEADIKREFGMHAKVFVAGNIPKRPLGKINMLQKKPGELRLIYLSLISKKKNLLQLINIIRNMKENILLDIYGPVKDESYWKQCMGAINDCADKITYRGNVLPDMVQSTFGKYHASILLTKGENFGHALYESFSSGRPVITSYFTPWNQLADKNAGWNVDISDETGIATLISAVCDMDQSLYDVFCSGAYSQANEYYQNGFDIGSYKKLFASL